MALERTFAIIKPDAVEAGQQGEILSRIQKAGFKIVAMKSHAPDERRGRRILCGAQGAAFFW